MPLSEKVRRNTIQKPELLAPAGTLEKLKFAVHYGADAVYIAGKRYGLRAFAGNFDSQQMAEGIAYAHSRQVKVYVTVNIFSHNEDLQGMEEYLQELLELGVDAIIVSDPGIIRIAREKCLICRCISVHRQILPIGPLFNYGRT